MIRSIDIADFKYSIENFISESPLPLEVKRYVLKDIFTDITEKAHLEMLEQASERESKHEQSIQ